MPVATWERVQDIIVRREIDVRRDNSVKPRSGKRRAAYMWVTCTPEGSSLRHSIAEEGRFRDRRQNSHHEDSFRPAARAAPAKKGSAEKLGELPGGFVMNMKPECVKKSVDLYVRRNFSSLLMNANF